LNSQILGLEQKGQIRSLLAAIILLIFALISSKDSEEATHKKLWNALNVFITLSFASLPLII